MWSRKSNKLGSRQGSEFQGVEEEEADDDVANGRSSKRVLPNTPANLVCVLQWDYQDNIQLRTEDLGQKIRIRLLWMDKRLLLMAIRMVLIHKGQLRMNGCSLKKSLRTPCLKVH